MNLRHDVGQLLLVGLAGTEFDATERAWLRLIRPAGTVLFRRNIEEAPQVHGLLESLETLIGDGPLFHAVDVEGGLAVGGGDVPGHPGCEPSLGQVLPDPATFGKDMGIMNIGNTLPQSITPVIAPLVLTVGGYPGLYASGAAAVAVAAVLATRLRTVR